MKKCGSKEKLKGLIAPVNTEKEVCTMAASPEHARLDSPDMPCDDARGTNSKKS